MLGTARRRKDRALWATALYAGLRRGELQALRREDVDLATGVIHVERGWDEVRGRDCAEVEAGAPQGADPGRAARPAGRVPDGRPASGRIFAGLRGHLRPRPRGGRGCRCRAAHAARVPPRLRGADDRRRRQREGPLTFMGHANIRITLDQYGHLLPGAEDEAAGLLDAFLARGRVGERPECTETVPHPTESRS